VAKYYLHKKVPRKVEGCPAGMIMYAIGILPLMLKLDKIGRQVWFADDSGWGGSLKDMKLWWDKLRTLGPKFGYHRNPSKTKLLVKDSQFAAAEELFQGTGIHISTTGERYLGAPIGSTAFAKQFIARK